LQDILKGDYLLAHHESDRPLSALYGGPLWLLVFDRYTYKGLSQINRLTLCDAPQDASTSQTRGYSENGLWEPGSKTYAIDLKAYKTLDRPGQEIKLF
jgi:DMSO/TMAO reductase YedYZ molybdopterin-dependent catalytic subunit